MNLRLNSAGLKRVLLFFSTTVSLILFLNLGGSILSQVPNFDLLLENFRI